MPRDGYFLVMSDTPREKIEALRQGIEVSPEIADEDAELLFEFTEAVDDDFSDRRHAKFLEYSTVMAEGVDDGLLARSLEDREATEEIVDWIFENYQNDEVNRNFRVALRVFAKRVSEGDDDELPPSVDWVSTVTSPENVGDNPGHYV